MFEYLTYLSYAIGKFDIKLKKISAPSFNLSSVNYMTKKKDGPKADRFKFE